MRRLVFAAALASTACATAPARADIDQETDYTPIVQACVTAAVTDDALLACRGAASGPCIERDGGATQMMVMCHSYEADAWELIMERAAAELTAAFPASAITIADAQRYWQSYREQECSFAQQRWGAGSGAQVEFVRCMAQLGADRGIALLLIQRHPD